ncbi:MAG: DUF3047 domain-containing protein [Nitrospirota bacterium]
MKIKRGGSMKQGAMIWRSLAVGLVVCGSLVMQSAAMAQGQSIVLEDFQAKDAEGFPLNWEHENQRSQSKGRDAYKVQTEDDVNFLSAKDAGQRVKKKKIDWDPKAFPILTWRWRLQKAATDAAEPIAAIYASLDTDLLFIPVFTKYVWSATKPEGTLTEGGIFSGSEIVVQSGTKAVGQWFEERVNVYEDFKRIHKHEPAAKAWGISIIAASGVEIDFGSMVASDGR